MITELIANLCQLLFLCCLPYLYFWTLFPWKQCLPQHIYPRRSMGLGLLSCPSVPTERDPIGNRVSTSSPLQHWNWHQNTQAGGCCGNDNEKSVAHLHRNAAVQKRHRITHTLALIHTQQSSSRQQEEELSSNYSKLSVRRAEWQSGTNYAQIIPGTTTTAAQENDNDHDDEEQCRFCNLKSVRRDEGKGINENPTRSSPLFTVQTLPDFWLTDLLTGDWWIAPDATVHSLSHFEQSNVRLPLFNSHSFASWSFIQFSIVYVFDGPFITEPITRR